MRTQLGFGTPLCPAPTLTRVSTGPPPEPPRSRAASGHLRGKEGGGEREAVLPARGSQAPSPPPAPAPTYWRAELLEQPCCGRGTGSGRGRGRWAWPRRGGRASGATRRAFGDVGSRHLDPGVQSRAPPSWVAVRKRRTQCGWGFGPDRSVIVCILSGGHTFCPLNCSCDFPAAEKHTRSRVPPLITVIYFPQPNS